MDYALVGAWWMRNDAQSMWIKIGAGSWVEQSIDPLLELGSAGGYAYPTGDGSGDDALFVLSQAINTAVYAAPGWATAFARLTVSSLGIITLEWYDTDALGALQIAFDHPTLPDANNNSYFLHDLLRMTTDPTSIITVSSGNPGTQVGVRTHGYGIYPLRYLMSDLDDFEARVSQAVPDVGTPQTLRTAHRRRRRIGIRTDKAYPRAAVWNEYHDLVDFMDFASRGRPFRLYPDRTLIISGTAYADVSAPFGYSTYVLDKDSASWRPEPVSGNWYKVMDTSLLAWEI